MTSICMDLFTMHYYNILEHPRDVPAYSLFHPAFNKSSHSQEKYYNNKHITLKLSSANQQLIDSSLSLSIIWLKIYTIIHSVIWQ
jgi:hypothetical protein